MEIWTCLSGNRALGHLLLNDGGGNLNKVASALDVVGSFAVTCIATADVNGGRTHEPSIAPRLVVANNAGARTGDDHQDVMVMLGNDKNIMSITGLGLLCFLGDV
jgi:hypothetical protein